MLTYISRFGGVSKFTDLSNRYSFSQEMEDVNFTPQDDIDDDEGDDDEAEDAVDEDVAGEGGGEEQVVESR